MIWRLGIEDKVVPSLVGARWILRARMTHTLTLKVGSINRLTENTTQNRFEQINITNRINTPQNAAGNGTRAVLIIPFNSIFAARKSLHI